MTIAGTTQYFKSIHHPGDAPLALVLVRSQTEATAIVVIALLAVSFVFLMQGYSVWQTLVWVLPAAYVATAIWAAYELRRKPAEIVLKNGLGEIRSVWDVARINEGDEIETALLVRVFPPQKVDGEVNVAIGDTMMTIRPQEWPDFGQLTRALSDAAQLVQ